ncbi:MAG: cyclic pyranopterin monophosphate synthase MoaC [Nitrospiraceae bacterium]|nr:cyclic pyranopterin monophosphate synthase MoaC [Nitrospiraceae bacterium]
MKRFTHFDKRGQARMVDASAKSETKREAVASGSVSMNKETFEMIREGGTAKGDVLGVARVAGIMAAKKTSEIIPMCHPLNIASVTVEFEFDETRRRIGIEAKVKNTGRTGVEMEALTAVAATALTIYDMCKAVDKRMVISDILLREKRGGKSGMFRR